MAEPALARIDSSIDEFLFMLQKTDRFEPYIKKHTTLHQKEAIQLPKFIFYRPLDHSETMLFAKKDFKS